MIFVFLNSACILLFQNMQNIQFRVYWKNLETNGQWLAVSLWFLTGIYFVEIDHLNRPRTLRVITFTKDNCIHTLIVSFREKKLFWFWVTLFWDTRYNCWNYQLLQLLGLVVKTMLSDSIIIRWNYWNNWIKLLWLSG